MKSYRVVMNVCQESFTGVDYQESEVTLYIDASTQNSAKHKAINRYFYPNGKKQYIGNIRLKSIWAEEI